MAKKAKKAKPKPRPAAKPAGVDRAPDGPVQGVRGRPKVDNGLRSFAIHQPDGSATDRAAGPFAAAAAVPARPSTEMSAESAARHYLEQSLASPAIPQFAAAVASGAPSEFKSLGVEVIPITDTQTVKFRQYYRKVPVYGSLVTVELDRDNQLVSINSSLGDPANVDHIARVSPSEVVDGVRTAAGYPTGALDVVPRLVYYFDTKASRWRLAYLTENVLKRIPPEEKTHLPQLVDYITDAHTGDIVAELPRTQTADEDVEERDVLDSLNKKQAFFAVRNGANRVLHDRRHNVRTHDFTFRDIELQSTELPGGFVPNPPDPWAAGAVSAHVNAVAVAAFLKDVLRRDSLDNQGQAIVSSVNCKYFRHGTDPTGREWRNAAWIGTQMVYGQRRVGTKMRSYAAAMDVVAHEICHGLTDRTARLQYQDMSGALNESYSDIFGIVISNFSEADVDRWNWAMGEDLSETGIPLRDLSDPARFGQPAHMDDYLQTESDFGGVHTNSGIHNKAAHNMLTARSAGGQRVFTPTQVIQLFYLALTQHLSRTSGFADSRRGVTLAARSLFRRDGSRDAKIAAIGAAFDAVGITES